MDDDDREIAEVAEDALGMAEAFMSAPEDEDPGVIPEDDSPMGPHGNGAGRPGAD